MCYRSIIQGKCEHAYLTTNLVLELQSLFVSVGISRVRWGSSKLEEVQLLLEGLVREGSSANNSLKD